MHCPCQSGLQFSACCQPLINGEQVALTPESLMRSRYTAYALKYTDYIYATYTTDARLSLSKAEIAQWAGETHWIKLIVHASSPVTIEPVTVSFSAYYIHQSTYAAIHETSVFIKEAQCWRYHSALKLAHEEVAQLNRNSACPCASGLKFKRCCLTKTRG